jgi:hypothetical protein
VWVKGNVDAMDKYMAPNYVDHPNLPRYEEKEAVLAPGDNTLLHEREPLLLLL